MTDLTMMGLDTGVVRAGGRLAAYDLDSGKPLWTSESLPMREIREVRRITGDVAFAMGPLDDRTYRVIGLELGTGRVLWINDSIAVGPGKAKEVFPYTYMAQHADSTVILTFSRGGIVRVVPRTGQLMWRLDSKPPFSLGWPAQSGLEVVYGLGTALPLFLADDLVTVSGALNVRTGSPLWTEPEKPAHYATAMSRTSHGILRVQVFKDIGSRVLQMVDPATGAALWQEPIKLKGLAYYTIRNDTAFVATDRGLTILDLGSGTLMKQYPLPDFTGGEEALVVRSESNGDLLLESSHNLMRVTTRGDVIFHLHYGQPTVGLKPLLAVVMPTLRNPENLTYVHTNDSDALGQKGIVLVDREQGQELGTVRRKDRAPYYVIDATSVVAVGIDERRLTGYRFVPLPK